MVKEFILLQNYPNPFNPSTTISYTIPNVASDLPSGQASFSLSNVVLKVFDVLGKEVATLVNELQSSGNYKVEFDANDFSSGMYFYTIRSGNFFKSKKMLLLR